ncbi:MAG: SRPBCC family protein [Patescibacteria group bacterium]
MNSVKKTIIINKPAFEVFNFTTNPDNTPRWVDGVVKEEASENPVKLGTIYRSQDQSGGWCEFEITAFEDGFMFEMTKKDDNHHVVYIFKPFEPDKCELDYRVWVKEGAVSERFSETNIETILQKLKVVVES